jgi:hypothetical protein
MKMQDKMALMGAGAVVDVSNLVHAPASDGGGASQKSRQSAPASKNEPAVSLG